MNNGKSSVIKTGSVSGDRNEQVMNKSIFNWIGKRNNMAAPSSKIGGWGV